MNHFFNFFSNPQEQQLINSIMQDAIGMYGVPVLYIPRNIVYLDPVLGEDAISTYTKTYQISAYVKNIAGFGGDGDFMAKFGLQIRDTCTFSLSKLDFEKLIGSKHNVTRPYEGDLIFLQFGQDNINKTFLFNIKFVEHEKPFYTIGIREVYELECELFEYGNERFATGIPKIDIIQYFFSDDMASWSFLTENNYYLIDEFGYALVQQEFDLDTTDVQSENDDLVLEAATTVEDTSESDPFSYSGH